jgi:hypothetical protein
MDSSAITLLLEKIKTLEDKIDEIENKKMARMRWITKFIVIILSLIVSHGTNTKIISEDFLEKYILFNNAESPKSD